jgi:hypothetical protein
MFKLGWGQWLKPVILITQRVEIKRMVILRPAQGKKSARPYLNQ